MTAAVLDGQRFFRLVVQQRDGHTRLGEALWLCVCDCGGVARATTMNLRKGRVKSCGCLKREKTANGLNHRTHGMYGTTEHTIWSRMKQRCLDPNDAAYSRYGGRGITVCERWLKLENFYADMGPRPSKEYSLDRINNDGNYEPGNCRWATAKEQANNRRPAKRKTVSERLTSVGTS